jgi:hypothetical protein
MMVRIQARRLLGITTILVTLCSAVPAASQKATERFIPIGQSPGVSHVLTEVGKIETVDPRRKTITMATPSGILVIGVRDGSKIWVDRSKLKQTNLVGGFADLKRGRTIEVRFVDIKKKQLADWVKVESPAAR